MARTELVEQAFPLDFSEAFRLVAAEELPEEMRTADTWRVREAAFCAYQTLTVEDAEVFATLLCGRISDREAVLEIVATDHDWWAHEAVLTAPRKRGMPELHVVIASDHLFLIMMALKGYARVLGLPPEWQAWMRHDEAYRRQEDAKDDALAD